MGKGRENNLHNLVFATICLSVMFCNCKWYFGRIFHSQVGPRSIDLDKLVDDMTAYYEDPANRKSLDPSEVWSTV